MTKLNIQLILVIIVLCQLNWSMNVKLLGFFPGSSSKTSSINDRWIVQSRSMFRMAIFLSQQMNMTFNGEYLNSEEISTDDDIMITFNSTCNKVLQSKIVGFIGPAYSNEVRYLSSFAYRLGIPLVSYSATSPDFLTIDNGIFYRISPSDEKIVLGLKMLFEQYRWKSCLIIYQNDEFGYNGMQLLSQQFTQINIKIFETIKFDRYQQTFQIDFHQTLFNQVQQLWKTYENQTYPDNIDEISVYALYTFDAI